VEKVAFEETETEFLIRVKHVLLAYPKNYGFIKNLNNKYVHKLHELGWSIPNTVFIEIPYVMTFCDELRPALAAAYIIDSNTMKSYFKCLITMCNYIPNTNYIELRDTILHEATHLNEWEPKFRSGIIKASDPTLEQDSRVNRAVSQIIEQQYTELTIQQSKKRSIQYAQKAQNSGKTIISGVFEYWLWKYLNNNFEKYKKLAYDSSPLMIESLDKLNQSFCSKLKDLYYLTFNYDIA
jgi:hypothetical protein